MQRGDVALAETEFLEHRVGVLAELRRPHRRVSTACATASRPGRRAASCSVLLGHALRDAEMLHLRIGEHFIDGIDRPARATGRVQALDPLRAGAADQMLVDVDVKRVAIFERAAPSMYSGIFASSGASMASQNRFQMVCPAVAMLI